MASQDHLALVGELVWRQHSRPRLHHRLTLRSPNGTLCMGGGYSGYHEGGSY
jgi:hypothetical protein